MLVDIDEYLNRATTGCPNASRAGGGGEIPSKIKLDPVVTVAQFVEARTRAGQSLPVGGNSVTTGGVGAVDPPPSPPHASNTIGRMESPDATTRLINALIGSTSSLGAFNELEHLTLHAHGGCRS